MRLLDRSAKEALDKKNQQTISLFRPETFETKYLYQVWLKEWDATVWVSIKFHQIWLKLSDNSLSFWNTWKEVTVLSRLLIDHSDLTHSFILKEEEPPVCVVCNTIITIKHILIECADNSGGQKEILWGEICVFTLSKHESWEDFWLPERDWCFL